MKTVLESVEYKKILFLKKENKKHMLQNTDEV